MVVGADAYIGPAECTVFTEIYGEFTTSQRADVGIGPTRVSTPPTFQKEQETRMRMRRRNNLAPRMEACESVWIHDPEALRGKWRSLMPSAGNFASRSAAARGKFTVETAEAEPDVLLIAIERVQDALVLAMEAAIRKGLKNVFFVSLDAANIDQFFCRRRD